jgi:hypothetical protein
VGDQVAHPYKPAGKIMVLYALIFIFLGKKWKTYDSASNESKRFLTSVCCQFLHEWNFGLFQLFQKSGLYHPFRELITQN